MWQNTLSAGTRSICSPSSRASCASNASSSRSSRQPRKTKGVTALMSSFSGVVR